ncbi:histidine kinase [Beutenbergia cavernae DSM 12333]|uniref:histidine kinase n=1 Tax=Beutenbergia cavernae (strain ATCC BAA-8 / DSM 12333 / CCUG 43141 / JCM 11478 / NBRC 16432 / NCIMB 13614 / HKI 0122) TaxID=471853 RepID=C5C112_BEUC1|nr:ATP-binding protein [Beutenbergia cavernae]ACQ79416.1 histidine kinase [Beutenbergia cavernae DSM 12333]
MRRRVLLATISAVVVAVILIGVPTAVLGALMVRDAAVQNLEVRTAAVARQVERYFAINAPLSPDALELWVEEDSALAASITVTTPDGEVIHVGPDYSDQPTWLVKQATPSGGLVVLDISGYALAWRMGQVVVYVVIASAVAFVIATLLARYQARRLAAPLVYLAASAEQIGSGQVRPRLEPSGVEEIDLVAAELARTSDRMAARLAAERQFAADASHQLRTPLTALSMRLEEIQALTTDDDVREEARVSLEQIERLVAVVDDLLTNSRRAGGGTTEVVHLADVFHQQEDEWAPTYARSGRKLVFDDAGPASVLASPGALAQVLATILENSLKYGAGTTRVACRTSSSGHGVVIEVSDEGPGVDAKLAPRIFERSVTSGKGSGLGLALARDLVAADGGRLELRQASPPVFAIFLSAVPTRLDPDRVLPPGSLVAVGRRRRRP